MVKAAIFFLAHVLLAQTPSDTALVNIPCENTSLGELSMFEIPAVSLSMNASFLKQSQCGSVVTTTRLAVGSCSVVLLQSEVESEPVYTPSPTLPVLSWLDAGPAITVSGPNGEATLKRRIQGASTGYGIASARISGGSFLAAGSYRVAFEKGRELGPFEGSFEFTPLAIVSPPANFNLSGEKPPTLTWSGGDAIADAMDFFARVTSADGRRGYDIRCRLADGKAGSFTIPTDVWEQVPATLRAAGVATMQLSASSVVARLPVPELESGFRVVVLQSPFVTVRLVP